MMEEQSGDYDLTTKVRPIQPHLGGSSRVHKGGGNYLRSLHGPAGGGAVVAASAVLVSLGADGRGAHSWWLFGGLG